MRKQRVQYSNHNGTFLLAPFSLCLPPSDQVRNLLGGLTKAKGTAAVDSAYSVYSSGWGSQPDQAIVKKTVADIETDFLFLVPTQIALQLHAEKSRSALTGPKFIGFDNKCLYRIKYYNVFMSS